LAVAATTPEAHLIAAARYLAPNPVNPFFSV
jgi:hypothetical protein